MKKFLAILLVFVFFSSFSFAESIDLESMSEFELIELQHSIQERLYEIDNHREFVLYPGVYVIGEDLEAGQYVFSVLEYRDDDTPTATFITVWPDEDRYGSIMTKDVYQSSMFDKKVNPEIQFNLKDGMYMKLNFSVFQAIKLR